MIWNSIRPPSRVRVGVRMEDLVDRSPLGILLELEPCLTMRLFDTFFDRRSTGIVATWQIAVHRLIDQSFWRVGD